MEFLGGCYGYHSQNLSSLALPRLKVKSLENQRLVVGRANNLREHSNILRCWTSGNLWGAAYRWYCWAADKEPAASYNKECTRTTSPRFFFATLLPWWRSCYSFPASYSGF